MIYRPPEGKLKNVKTKDYLGKAKLVAAVDPEDAFTGFSGAQQQKVFKLIKFLFFILLIIYND